MGSSKLCLCRAGPGRCGVRGAGLVGRCPPLALHPTRAKFHPARVRQPKAPYFKEIDLLCAHAVLLPLLAYFNGLSERGCQADCQQFPWIGQARPAISIAAGLLLRSKTRLRPLSMEPPTRPPPSRSTVRPGSPGKKLLPVSCSASCVRFSAAVSRICNLAAQMRARTEHSSDRGLAPWGWRSSAGTHSLGWPGQLLWWRHGPRCQLSPTADQCMQGAG